MLTNFKLKKICTVHSFNLFLLITFLSENKSKIFTRYSYKTLFQLSTKISRLYNYQKARMYSLI